MVDKRKIASALCAAFCAIAIGVYPLAAFQQQAFQHRGAALRVRDKPRQFLQVENVTVIPGGKEDFPQLEEHDLPVDRV